MRRRRRALRLPRRPELTLNLWHPEPPNFEHLNFEPLNFEPLNLEPLNLEPLNLEP